MLHWHFAITIYYMPPSRKHLIKTWSDHKCFNRIRFTENSLNSPLLLSWLSQIYFFKNKETLWDIFWIPYYKILFQRWMEVLFTSKLNFQFFLYLQFFLSHLPCSSTLVCLIIVPKKVPPCQIPKTSPSKNWNNCHRTIKKWSNWSSWWV